MSKAAAGTGSNGAAAGQTGAAASKPALRPRDARQARFALSFSQIVAVLMRDPNFRNLRLADLEWLVIPPILSGQFRLAQAPVQAGGPRGQTAKANDKGQEGGILVPVAVALWARVSANLDKGLSSNLDKEVKLHPAQWASGDNIWLMAVGGDPRAVPKFLEQLREKDFSGKQVKMRLRGADGKTVVRTFAAAPKA